MTHKLMCFRQGFYIAKKDPKMLSEVIIQVIIIAQLLAPTVLLLDYLKVA